ncbi:MAG: restriction endonuclease, SacI family [Chloroflexi bacterium]|nr:restriction endonuclease, SacI family [Chloroflexota bacterium]MCL5074523.1 restriction endonuclease, SacI family [Chloroflexota bacterium]
MPPIDYNAARNLLDREFAEVESQFLQGTSQQSKSSLMPHFDIIFRSQTQAYREVLLGCVIARLQDRAIDIHKPYVNQGPHAYNGRTLDERVVNPFLQDKRVPSSRGPFLSTFRRSVGFDSSTRDGLRDKEGFDALLSLIDYVAGENNDANLLAFLRYLLFRFLELRREVDIPPSRLQRISLEQYDDLITGLLSTLSGGRFPVILVEAAFEAIRDSFGLSWQIESQGINVADRPSGAGGDVTIKSGDTILLAAEITERPVDKSRVVATFNTKIAPQGIEDYLFFVRPSAVGGCCTPSTAILFAGV